jgi:hypothetical protein
MGTKTIGPKPDKIISILKLVLLNNKYNKSIVISNKNAYVNKGDYFRCT